jgi:hypothetical protein
MKSGIKEIKVSSWEVTVPHPTSEVPENGNNENFWISGIRNPRFLKMSHDETFGFLNLDVR